MDISDDSVWQGELTIRDWCLVFAVPTTRSEFEASPQSSFCSQYWDWAYYEESLASHFRELIDPLESVGLEVVRNAQLRDFSKAVASHANVLLYSHCDFGTSIEFCGTMVRGTKVVRQIPRRAVGILDLSVCAVSNEFVNRIKKRAPNLGVASYGVKVSAMASLHYIAYFLSRFLEPSMTYKKADIQSKMRFAEAKSN